MIISFLVASADPFAGAGLRRTVSHWCRGDYLGLDANGRHGVRTADGREVRFNMTTGLPVR